MNFLDQPLSHIGARRSSIDVCRDACAIERFERKDGHFWIVPACIAAGLFVVVLLAIGRFA